MNCKFCGLPVEEKSGGHRQREYCNDAHRQANFRQQHQADQDAALLAELEALRAKVADQAQEIADLRSRLDVERRYLSDTTPRYFKSWLKKQSASPLVSKMFADPSFPPRGSRGYYEAHMRSLHCTDEEREDFVRLWKLMLLQS